jgi:hypothetical protein
MRRDRTVRQVGSDGFAIGLFGEGDAHRVIFTGDAVLLI